METWRTGSRCTNLDSFLCCIMCLLVWMDMALWFLLFKKYLSHCGLCISVVQFLLCIFENA